MKLAKSRPGKSSRFVDLTLTPQAQTELARGLAGVPYPTGASREEMMRHAHKVIIQTVPDAILRHLDRLKDDPAPAGAVLIRNGPIDLCLPRTPTDGRWAYDLKAPTGEKLILGIGRVLGQPFSFRVEKGGDLVHNVVPVRGQEKSLTNMGSKEELGFHTELAYFSHPPRWLILYCLKADHDRVAETPLADLRDALDELDPRHAVELRKPAFRVRCPFIFDPMFGPDGLYSEPRPVLTGPDNSPDIRVALYGELTQPLTVEGRLALLALDDAVRKVARRIKLTPGDMVILSNHVVLHSRTAFTPRFDGADRWLLRIHVADTLWPFREWQERSARVLGA